ncbi:short-chain dehydrogenase/reductase, partial [Rhizoctonia solani AG-3 Rhs1AP]
MLRAAASARPFARVCQFCTSCHVAGPSKPTNTHPRRKAWTQRIPEEEESLWTASPDSPTLSENALSSFPLSELLSPRSVSKSPTSQTFSPFLKDISQGAHPNDFGSPNPPTFRRHQKLGEGEEGYDDHQRGLLADLEQYITDRNLDAVIKYYDAFVKAHPRGAVALPTRTIVRFSALLARTRPRTRDLFQRLLSLLAILRAAGEPLRSWQWNSLADFAGRGFRNTTLEDYRAVVAVVQDMGKDPQAAFKPDVVTYNTLLAAATRTREHRAVQHALALMQASKVPPDRLSFLTLIPFYGRVGELPQARDTLQAMVKEGWEVGVDGLTAAIWAWGQSGGHNLEVAMGIYHALRRNVWDGGVSDQPFPSKGVPDELNPVLNIPGLSPPLPPSLIPNRITYTALIQCLCYHGDLVRALQIYRAYTSSPKEPSQELPTKRAYLSEEETTVVIFRGFFIGFVRHCDGARSLSRRSRSLPPMLPPPSYDLSFFSHLPTQFKPVSSSEATVTSTNTEDIIHEILKGNFQETTWRTDKLPNPWSRAALLAVTDSYIAALGKTTPHASGLWWLLRATAGTAEPGRESECVCEMWERLLPLNTPEIPPFRDTRIHTLEMPYSEHTHYAPVGTVLSKFSAIRNALGNFIIPLLSDMPLPSADLHGKQAIVTGANSGIGFETAKALAGMGARVVLACRNKDKAEKARKDIEQVVQGAQVEVEILDCASLESVRQFVHRWGTRKSTRVDILVNNAGRILNTRITTIDGYEDTYQANHLSHALLALSLLQSSHFSPNARIITVSSISFFSSPPLDAHNTNNSDVISQYEEGATLPWETMVLLYSRAKACQAIWSMALQRKLQETEKWKDIVVQACHPGTVKSSMLSQSDGPGGSSGAALNAFKSFVNTFGISNEQGAVVPVWLSVALQPTQRELRGLYWDRMRWMWVAPWSMETKRQDHLWDKWCLDIGISFP